MAGKDGSGARAQQRSSSSAVRRRFTDSAELTRPPARSPEDRRLSAAIVAVAGACVAGLITYLAIGFG